MCASQRKEWSQVFLLTAMLGVLPPTLGRTQPAPPDEAQQKPSEFSETISVNALRMEVPLKEIAGVATVADPDVLKDVPKTVGADEAMKLVPGVSVDNQRGNRHWTLSAQFHLADVAFYLDFFIENPDELRAEEAEEEPDEPDSTAVFRNGIQSAERITEGPAGIRHLDEGQDLNFMFLYRGPPGVHPRMH